jgi:hypothetical protein
MVATQFGRDSRVGADDGRASTASGTRSRGRRAGSRLWALLNAQALLTGAAGPRGAAGLIEDDRRRMAGRRVT